LQILLHKLLTGTHTSSPATDLSGGSCTPQSDCNACPFNSPV